MLLHWSSAVWLTLIAIVAHMITMWLLARYVIRVVRREISAFSVQLRADAPSMLKSFLTGSRS